ncbi:unnamed protein product [Caenorhabditis nigoni]
MNRTLYYVSFLLLLTQYCSSTGVLWLRVSSSKDVVARMELLNRENSSRYGISFDLQLDPKFHEFVFPFPPPSSKSLLPVLEYTIQMMKCRDGDFVGQKFSTRLPVLVNEPWIHKTVTDKIGISIFLSIRFECLPNYYGSKCQFYCTEGENCPKDECKEKKCQNNSQCLFNGTNSKCICQAGYSGELCEIKSTNSPIPISMDNVILFTLLFLFIFLFMVTIATVITFTRRKRLRKVSEPVDDNYYYGKYHLESGKLQILTPRHVIFASL